MKQVFAYELKKKMELEPSCYLLTADLGYGAFDEIAKSFPNNYINVGVAECGMVLIASGMALLGDCVFVYSIGNFHTLRCLEFIRNNICYHNLNVIIVSVGAGFSYGQLGYTHHAIEDLNCMHTLPRIKTFCPFDSKDLSFIFHEISKKRGPAYIRLPRTNHNISCTYTSNRSGLKIIDGSDSIVIIAYGPTTTLAIETRHLLLHHGIDSTVMTSIRIDNCVPKIVRQIPENAHVYVIEETVLNGSLASALSTQILKDGIRVKKFQPFTINQKKLSKVGDESFLRSIHGFCSKKIVKQILVNLSK